MSFDIHALDRASTSGELEEDRLTQYLDNLLQLFAASPEGQAYLEAHPGGGFWAYQFGTLAYNYLDRVLPNVTAADAEEIISDLFPRKISVASPDDTSDALPELVAFWEYLARAYRLPHADAILRYLRSVAPDTFREWMLDPANFGMAKSFFMLGQQAGFDMSDPGQADKFMAAYNASLALGGSGMGPTGLPPDLELPLPLESLPGSASRGLAQHNKKARAKGQRKMAKASRQKNRRRK